jgi:protoporphyrinogen oxidase
MSSKKQSIIILGAGPAGLMLAFKLLQRKDLNLRVTVVEKQSLPGGIAASFQEEGIWLDYGSHRLHSTTPDHILCDIKNILGSSLLRRKRNGRIRLQGRFLKFPLKPIDCLFHLPFSFLFGVLLDLLKKPFRSSTPAVSFADQLLQGLGSTICEKFYFPYAYKLWGYLPDQIDVEQAKKRVSAGTISKILKKMAAFLPGIRTQKSAVFYYPKEGIGQISNALAEKVTQMGGRILYNTEATGITKSEGKITSISAIKQNGEHDTLNVDFIFTTIPVTQTVHLLGSSTGSTAQTAANSLKYRNMVFLYLLMDCGQWQPFDAHYFPEKEYIFSRISEGKNYNDATLPSDKTIICCEIPCQHDDTIWLADDEHLKRLVLEDMKKATIPVTNLVRVFSKRQTNVYPIYTIGYPEKLTIIERHLAETRGLISLGRQGLFTHDNIHHTMMMADRAAQCFGNKGQWNASQWDVFCEEFSGYVVED